MTSGCGRAARPLPGGAVDPEDGITILSYHLDGYGFSDRDADGAPDDPKPPEECEAAAKVIADTAADIVALQGLGNSNDFARLCRDIHSLGESYPHQEVLQIADSSACLALLSRHPIASRQSKEHVPYRIGDHQLNMSHGILDVTLVIEPATLLRLVVSEFKDKSFHPAGQTEMRRNEGRLLANHLRFALEQNPETRILVAGALHDEPESAPVEELTVAKDAPVMDLRPGDDRHARWTVRRPGRDAYLRTDYLLASPGLVADIDHSRTRIVEFPEVHVASTHRPLLATVRLPRTSAPK